VKKKRRNYPPPHLVEKKKGGVSAFAFDDRGPSQHPVIKWGAFAPPVIPEGGSFLLQSSPGQKKKKERAWGESKVGKK